MHQKIENTFQDIHAQILSTPAGNDSFFSGNLGLAYYHGVLYQAFGREQDSEAAALLLEGVIDRFNSDSNNLLGAHYGGGAAGFAFVMNALNIALGLEIEEDEFESINEFLFNTARQQIKVNNIDCLHGTFGVIYYLANRQPHPYLDMLVEEICNNAKVTEHGIWFENILESEEKDSGVINLSLSHGLTGMLLILLKALPLVKCRDLVKSTVAAGIRLLLYYRRNRDSVAGDYSFFPAKIVPRDNYIEERVRLGWCYGDLGPALLFYRAAPVLENMELIRIADEIGINTLRREDDTSTWISDPYFCHGAAGLSVFYKVLQEESGRDQYAAGAAHWMQRTVSMLGEESRREAHYQNRHGLLDGLVGVNLTLLSYLDKNSIKWSNAFFL
ncbi:MAG TPA: lanthionine synthetase LanC family protein [Chitinophaga sp.]|uniref:lanthionine synthetase LanC family protein n=1 Tax=Chitinophaga sp. TaxID=1869181 RepID=UPI002BB74130|nr:lanthionine synthetase LanC family protein [Chitinophaga sp.]HVI43844.1 lanthionine synthetase LanC family protein [Chitinophaga sp.]